MTLIPSRYQSPLQAISNMPSLQFAFCSLLLLSRIRASGADTARIQHQAAIVKATGVLGK